MMQMRGDTQAACDSQKLWWAGSDEWGPWTSAPAVRALAELPSNQFERLLLIETVTNPPERFLFGIAGPAPGPAPGSPVGAIVFSEPQGWDGEQPLNLADLRYRGEAVVAATPEEAPRLSEEDRERRRKGWAF
jgi:hypothetical protein